MVIILSGASTKQLNTKNVFVVSVPRVVNVQGATVMRRGGPARVNSWGYMRVERRPISRLNTRQTGGESTGVEGHVGARLWRARCGVPFRNVGESVKEARRDVRPGIGLHAVHQCLESRAHLGRGQVYAVAVSGKDPLRRLGEKVECR